MDRRVVYPFLGSPRPFAEVYPTLARLTVRVEQRRFRESETREYSATADHNGIPASVGCGNRYECERGGVALVPLVAWHVGQMIAAGETTRTEDRLCSGGLSMGRGMPRKQCLTLFRVTFELEYKPATS